MKYFTVDSKYLNTGFALLVKVLKKMLVYIRINKSAKYFNKSIILQNNTYTDHN